MVDTVGIEPTTTCLQSKLATLSTCELLLVEDLTISLNLGLVYLIPLYSFNLIMRKLPLVKAKASFLPIP